MPDYIVCPNVISKEDCKEIISFAKNKWESGKIHVEGDLEKIRNSDVVWYSEKKHFELVERLISDVCNDTRVQWKVQVDSIETMQITRYKVGQYYDFHIDGNGFDRMPVNNKARKISTSIILNDNFKGGEFEFLGLDKIEAKRGSAIVFPSWIPHRVKPVTKGIRYSLVAWVGGEPVE